MMNEVVPKFYRCLRQKRKMSQADFGVAVGKKRAAVSSWELGQARPSYDDERRLLLEHGFSWEETLEILSEALVEATGRPITILFGERDPDHPTHPLTLAERRLRESGARVPEKLRYQLQQHILAARGNAARTERENGTVLEHVEVCIAALAALPRNETEQEGEPRHENS